jgi:hypothetical protein
MKYYLVSYLVFENREIVENSRIGIPLHHFANTRDFKIMITKLRDKVTNPSSIVINSYKEVSMEQFNFETNARA